jgi:hypothetical protein
MEFSNSIFNPGVGRELESSKLEFSTQIFPFYKMLCINIGSSFIVSRIFSMPE